MRLAELAPTATATTSYLERFRDTELAEKVQPRCGTAAGRYRRACSNTRVRQPDGTRARACWAHLTREEKDAVTAARDAIITDRRCPTCRAAAGKPCTEDGSPTSIHSRRLVNPAKTLLSPAAATNIINSRYSHTPAERAMVGRKRRV